MPRLLVTGGAGFIGANFVHYWLAHHPTERLVVLDALTYAGNVANLDEARKRSEFRFVQADIREQSVVQSLLREERIDTIVHFAAESHVDRSTHGPDCFIETNVVGTHALLKAARQVWLEERVVERHRFHHVSTDEVYGSLSPDDARSPEHAPYAPNSPYSASKAASDHLVRAYHRTLQVTTSNCSNNYGPWQFPEKLIPRMIVNILHGRALPIYGDGRNRREWLHVMDHCRGIALILQNGIIGEVYNIGSGEDWENVDVVHLLCQLADEMIRGDVALKSTYARSPSATGLGGASLMTFVPDRPGHDRRYALDCDKIVRELGFQKTVSLEDGLRVTFAWYLDHESWWRSSVSAESPAPLRSASACEPLTNAAP